MKSKLYFLLVLNLYLDFLYCQIKDFEGNIYDTVQIGNQTWLTRNIRSKFYSDGDPVKNSDYKCVNGNCLNTDTFGLLYNFSGLTKNETARRIQGICPTGFLIPTPNEWHQLMLNLKADTTWLWKGAYNYVSDKVISQNYGGSNSSGLTIVPSGVYALGSYYNFGRSEHYKLIDSLTIKGITIFFDGSTNGTIRIDTFLSQEIARSSEQYLPCRCIKASTPTLVTSMHNKLQFNIYPNPSLDGNITVEVTEDLLNSSFELQIFSDLGVMVYRTTEISSTNFNLFLPKGIYLAKLINSKNGIIKMQTRKIVLLNY